jgi:hypothetical protein
LDTDRWYVSQAMLPKELFFFKERTLRKKKKPCAASFNFSREPTMRLARFLVSASASILFRACMFLFIPGLQYLTLFLSQKI